MENTENTTVEVESLDNMLATSASLLARAEAAQVEYENSLLAIAEAHGATYTHEGTVFQIRHRKDSKQGRPITYLCTLPGEPKTWLTGPKTKKEKAITTVTEVTEAAGPTVIE